MFLVFLFYADEESLNFLLTMHVCANKFRQSYISTLVVVLSMYVGRSGWCALCTVGYAGGGSVTLLADAETSTTHIVETNSDPAGIIGAGYPAMGGQLCSSVWFYLRLPGCLRADAVYLVRPLRSQTKDPADLDLHDSHRGPVRSAARSFLQRTGLRVRGMQTVQLRALHS